MKFPAKVRICEDVTRDGFQSIDQVISVEDKLTILDMVTDAGVQCIEVGAFSSYESMKKMRNTGEVFKQLKQRGNVLYRALVFAPDGAKEASDCGLTMSGSISLPFVSPFPGEGLIPMDTLTEIIKSFIDIGITEISLSDAAGLGTPALIYERFMELQGIFPEVSWMLHMHNTYGMGARDALIL